jgi:tetratricopeptide (TPR) repeat protein
MIVATDRHSKAYRLATHYLNQLRRANTAYRRGGESSLRGLQVLEQDWLQITHWQAWASMQSNESTSDHVADKDTLQLCSEFPHAGSELLNLRQNPQEALVWWQAALGAAQRLGDRAAEAGHQTAIAELNFKLSAFDQAELYAQEGLRLSEELDDSSLVTKNLNMLGRTAYYRADYAAAHELFEKSLNINRRTGNEMGSVSSLTALGNVAWMRGDYVTAKSYHEQVLAMCRRIGHHVGIATALANLCNLASTQRDMAAARTYAEQSLAIAHVLGDEQRIASGNVILANIARDAKDFATSMKYYLEGLDLQRKLGNQDGIARALFNLGQMAYLQGDYPAALNYTTESHTIYCSIDNRDEVITGYLRLAKVYARLGQTDSATHSLRQALEALVGTDATPTKHYALLPASELGVALGWPQKATLWLGLLLTDPSYVRELEIDNTLRDLYQRLETALGNEQFTTLIEQSKSLSLDSTIAEILGELHQIAST